MFFGGEMEHRDMLEYMWNKFLEEFVSVKCWCYVIYHSPQKGSPGMSALRSQHKYNSSTIQFKNKTSPPTFFAVSETLIFERKTLINPGWIAGLSFYITQNKQSYHIAVVPSTSVWVKKNHRATINFTVRDM